MKKLIVFSIIILFFKISHAQVVKTRINSGEEKYEVYFGPQNVFPIYPSVVEESIRSFNEKIEELLFFNNEFEEEIILLQNKKIRNSNKVDQARGQIYSNLETIFLLEDLIADWEEYAFKFQTYDKLLDSLNFKEGQCFNLILEQDIIKSNEVSIEYTKGELSYEEFIDSSFIWVDYSFPIDTFNIQQFKSSYERHFEHDRDLRKRFNENRKVKLPINDFDLNDKVEERIRKIFPSFSYDKKAVEFYRVKKLTSELRDLLFFSTDMNQQFFPIGIKIFECEN